MRSNPSSDSETVSMGVIQNSCACGAVSVTLTPCHSSTTRKWEPGATQGHVAKNAESRGAICERKRFFSGPIHASFGHQSRVRGRNFRGAIASAGERRIFRQLRGAAIRMFLLAAEKQQAETVARPAVVIEPAIKAGFLRARLLVNGLSAMRLASFQI